MGIIQLIALLCFYIMKLAGCNTIGKLNHNDPDCISNQTETNEPYDVTIKNLDTLDQLLLKLPTNNPTEATKSQAPPKKPTLLGGKASCSSGNSVNKIRKSKSQRKYNKITPSIELHILDNIGKDPDLGSTSIANIIYTQHGIDINHNTLSNYLSRNNLNYSYKREEAIENGNLKKIIQEIQAKFKEAKSQTPPKKPTLLGGKASCSSGKRKNDKIDLKLELYILDIIRDIPETSPRTISGKIYKKHNRSISDDQVRYYLKQNKLENPEKRCTAKNNGKLSAMIKKIQTKIKEIQNQTIAQATQSTVAERTLSV